MKPIFALACDFLHDRRGATAIEYCMIAFMISLACITGATAIGPALRGFFEQVAAGLSL
ncbi:Flp family type IVb pilin [Bosea sp. (in: a-proteobacteria)]|uniref:Flp family type IVb pilin n=1 Tax=Bosea sp. (in: a-proteobacteria) TaxID=1871050 RepID=UPI002FC8681E